MRKFLYVLGAITLTLLVLGSIGVGLAIYNGRGLDAGSKAFIDTAVPAISANWSKEQLLELATPELRDSVNPVDLNSLFNAFSRIGHLVEYEGATGQATMAFFTGSGSVVSASHVAKGRFQNGNATFKILLLKRNGHWLIHNFHVDSEANGEPARRI